MKSVVISFMLIGISNVLVLVFLGRIDALIISVVLAIVLTCLNTQGSPALHCTYDKDRLELSFNVMQMDNGIRYCKIQGNSL